MEQTITGWVIINNNHPNNPKNKQIYFDTFAYTKKECISKFINGSGETWKYWYRMFNFRANKAEMTINVKNEK